MGYAKISNLYKDPTIFNFRKVYALEKVEGTSAHIQWSNGRVSYYSGGATHDQFVAIFNHDALTQFFASKFTGDDTVRIYGEAYGGKIQAMAKSYGKDLCFIAFEVSINGTWLDVPKAEGFVRDAGLEFVPYELVECTEENLNSERDRDSLVAIRRGMGAGHMREGIVIRPPIEVRLNNGERCMAKHKRDDFRETRSPRKIGLDPTKLAVLEEAEAIAEEWCVPVRLQHVLNKLLLGGAEPKMEDIPNIVNRMIDDIFTEGRGEIVESKEARKAIGNKTVQLYKEYVKSYWKQKLKGA